MVKCGCAGSAGCACVIQGADGILVSGAGTVEAPYVVAAVVDPDQDNLLSAGPNGLMVDCADIAACVAAQTPSGLTDFLDSASVDFTRTGSGTQPDPYMVTADLIAVAQKTASTTFTRALAGANGVWEEVTELAPLVIAVAGTYKVDYYGRGAAVIPGGTPAVSTSTSLALGKNNVMIAGTEVMLQLVSQGVAGTAEPALQIQSSGAGADIVSCVAGDELSLYASRQLVAGGTNSIVSNTDGRCRIVATRIGA